LTICSIYLSKNLKNNENYFIIVQQITEQLLFIIDPTSSYSLLAPPSHQHRDEPSVLTAYASSIVSYNEIFKIMNIAPELELVKEIPRQVIF